MTNQNDILQATEQAVSNIDARLSELTKLEQAAAELESQIATLAQSEQEILNSDESDKARVKKLIESRAKLDVAKADAGKLYLEIEAAKEDAVFAAIRANNLIGSVEHGLITHRIEKVCELLSEVFEPALVKELRHYANYSRPVKALEREQFVFVASRIDLGLDAARKTRAVWGKLSAAVNSESSELTFIVAPSWLEEPAVRPAVAPFSKDVQFAGGKS